MANTEKDLEKDFWTITGPTGEDYDITVPKGTPEANVMQYFQQNYQEIAPEPEPSFLDNLDDFRDEAMTQLSFGLSDYTTAAGKKASDYLFSDEQKPYMDYVQAEKNRRDAYRKNYPKTSLAAGAVGALTNPVNTRLAQYMMGKVPVNVPMADATTKFVQQPIGTGEKILRGAKGGAMIGGLQGAGEQTNLEDALTRGGIGVASGAALGALLPATFFGIQKAWNMAGNSLARWTPQSDQETFAIRKMVEALRRDGFDSAEAAMKRIEELGPEGALMDAGVNSRKLLQSVIGRPGEGSEMVQGFLNLRQKGILTPEGRKGGQYRRIASKIDELIPEQLPGKPKQPEISKLYKKAYKEDPEVVIKSLDRLRKTPHGKKAWASAREQMENDMELMAKPDTELTALFAEEGGVPTGFGIAGQGVKLKAIDWFKRGYDDIIEKLTKQVEMGRASKAELRSAINQRKMLVRQTDAATKSDAWQKARAMSSSEFRNQEAQTLGTKFFNQSQKPGILEKRINSMAPEERHHFRMGMAGAIKDKVAGLTIRGDATKKLWEVPNLEQKIRIGFGDNKTFSQYYKFLQAEADMFESYGQMGGSRTAENIESAAEAAIDPNRWLQAMTQFKAGDPMSIARGTLNLVGGAKDRALMPEGTSRELAKLLMSKDPGIFDQTFKNQELIDFLNTRLTTALTKSLAGPSGQRY